MLPRSRAPSDASGPGAILRRHARRATLRVLAVALGLSVIVWYLGVDVWHAILFGGVLTIVGVIGSGDAASVQIDFIGWRDRGRRDRAGARTDVVELSQSLRGRRGRVSSTAVWRIAQIARRRLSAYGLDLDDAAQRARVEQLIGRRTYRVLTRPQGRPPRLRVFLSCLDVLDTLDAGRVATPSRSARPEPDALTPARRRARAR